MAQERVDSTFDLPLHSIREIREIRGQNHFRDRRSDRTRPEPQLSGRANGGGSGKSTQDAMTLKVGTAEKNERAAARPKSPATARSGPDWRFSTASSEECASRPINGKREVSIRRENAERCSKNPLRTSPSSLRLCRHPKARRMVDRCDPNGEPASATGLKAETPPL